MLINNAIFSKIDEIVERAYLDFTFELLGDKFFTVAQKRQIEGLGLIIGRRPLIELLYILVRLRSVPGYVSNLTLQELLDQVSLTGVLPIINDAHLYSIDHAKLQLNEAIENTKKEIKTKVSQAILSANNDFKNEVLVDRITSIPNHELKVSQGLKQLKKAIDPLKLGISYLFLRAFTTTLTNTINNAVVDQAAIQGLTDERIKKPEDIKVYKQVTSDGRLCNWCHSFYVNKDGSPKLYDLKELQANGSNDAKAKSTWKPVVGATHPRCRCQLKFVINSK